MNKLLVVKICILFLLNMGLLNASQDYLNIDAKHFEANKEKNILIFTGDVKMTKKEDILLCQKLVVKTEPQKQTPKEYKATGDVSFVLKTEDNLLKGKGDTVYYYLDRQEYIIIGNGFLEDTKEGKKVSAEKIYIDQLTGRTKIDGGKNKPIKFRLQLNEKKPKDNNEKS